jgi:hypothetical protein
MDRSRLRRVVVIKLGGSVLVNDESYRQTAKFLVRRLYKEAARERSPRLVVRSLDDAPGTVVSMHANPERTFISEN